MLRRKRGATVDAVTAINNLHKIAESIHRFAAGGRRVDLIFWGDARSKPGDGTFELTGAKVDGETLRIFLGRESDLVVVSPENVVVTEREISIETAARITWNQERTEFDGKHVYKYTGNTFHGFSSPRGLAIVLY